MSLVIVYSAFPDITPKQKEEIFAQLEKRNWIRDIYTRANDTDAIWYGRFDSNIPVDECREIAFKLFKKVATPYCKARLLVLAGQRKAVSG